MVIEAFSFGVVCEYVNIDYKVCWHDILETTEFTTLEQPVAKMNRQILSSHGHSETTWVQRSASQTAFIKKMHFPAEASSQQFTVEDLTLLHLSVCRNCICGISSMLTHSFQKFEYFSFFASLKVSEM